MTEQAKETPPVTEQETAVASEVKTETVDPLFKELGFKTNEAAAQSLQEGKKKITQQAQENAVLKQSLERPPVQEQVTDDDHFENPVATSRKVAEQTMQKGLNDLEWKMAAKLEKAKNPKEFAKLIPFMQKVGQLQPHLNNNAENMPHIVNLARDMWKAERKDQLTDFLEIADPEELAKLNLTKTGVSEAEKLANLSVSSASAAVKQDQQTESKTADGAMDAAFTFG